ncbi:MAG: hypothetical protein SO001_08125 [Alloprevotella sp.]|nr:hypothetical protein [Alloprevotella sp.]
MKKTYISPAMAVYSLQTEQSLLVTLSANPGNPGYTVDDDTEWDTNKKQPGFAGDMWDDMGEIGNF